MPALLVFNMWMGIVAQMMLDPFGIGGSRPRSAAKQESKEP